MPIERWKRLWREDPAEAARETAYWMLLPLAASLTFSNSLFEISCGVFAGFAILSLALSRQTAPLRSWFAAAAFAYLAVCALSVTQTEHLSTALKGVLKAAKGAALALLAVHVVDSRERFRLVYRCLWIVALVVALDALVQALTGFDLLRFREMTPYFGRTRRLTGPYHHANDFSAYLVMTLFLFAASAPPGSSRPWTWVRWGVPALLIYCLFQTYARAAWISAGAALAVLAVLRRNRWMILILAAAIGWALFLSPPMLRQRVHSIWDGRDSTMSERRLLWSEALRMSAERPWLGFGVNTYAKNEPRFKAPGASVDNQYAHNGYLHMAAEIGWVGLAAFLSVLAAFYARVLPLRARTGGSWEASAAIAIAAGVLAFLIHSLAETNLHSLRLVNGFWLAMGLALAAARLSEAPEKR